MWFKKVQWKKQTVNHFPEIWTDLSVNGICVAVDGKCAGKGVAARRTSKTIDFDCKESEKHDDCTRYALV